MWAILWFQFFSNVYLNLFSDACFTAVFLQLLNRPPFFFQYEICFSNVLDFLFVSTRAFLPCGGQNPCSKGGAWVSGLLHARESVKHMRWALPWSDHLPSGWWIHSPYVFTCRFYQNSKIDLCRSLWESLLPILSTTLCRPLFLSLIVWYNLCFLAVSFCLSC